LFDVSFSGTKCVSLFFSKRRANPMIPMTHFDMKYGPRTGSEEEKKHVKKIKSELAEILEAPHVLTQLKGDMQIRRLDPGRGQPPP
jgi:hypothetical protein